MRVASFFPFQTTYYRNGHNFIEKELHRENVSFRKNDNAFLAVADSQALQSAADRFRPELIRKRLQYWTLLLGPNFSKREGGAMNLGRFYSLSQLEYSPISSSTGIFPSTRSSSAPAKSAASGA